MLCATCKVCLSQGAMGQLNSAGSGGGLHWQQMGLANVGMGGQGGMPYAGQGASLQVGVNLYKLVMTFMNFDHLLCEL